jgi:predicted dinucleotide-binding enzyme
MGAGNVGGGLGTAFASAGHEVRFGVRDPDSDKTQVALRAAPGSRAMPPAEAVVGAEVVCFALRWEAAEEPITQLPSLAGVVVIDAMNRFGGDPTRSTAQDLADLLPGAKIAKAFNTIGFENFTTARARATPAAMFVAADDEDAKRVALELATEIGFEAYDAGPLSNARALEEMVKVWLALTRQMGRGIGFAISKS